MHPIHYGIFLEPLPPLFEEIKSRKQRIRSLIGDQVYLNHPPHCTIYHGTLASLDNWRTSLEEAVKSCKSFTTRTVENFVFYSDPLAQFGHTIAIRLQLDPNLFELQALVAKALQPHIKRNSRAIPSSLAKHSPFRESIELFNFPFVGEHWIPHFSISSLAVDKDSHLIADLLEAPCHFKVPVRELSIWEINDNYHNKLTTIRLAKYA